mmetsp:Transcript_3633/g.3072  ORF Transcript_3633/g.3072 Transcript_3633/m.3072 type:complete len:87 (+) Transcript_3633:1286-1546(+)
MVCQTCQVQFCWKCLKIIDQYVHFKTNPECWDTTGDTDVGYLTQGEFEEAKGMADKSDMRDGIVCPHCNKVTKKKTTNNYLSCSNC